MATNAFECPRCKRHTRHIELSAREMSAATGDTTIEQLANGLNDLLGFTKVIQFVADIKYWKCCNCGTLTARNSVGKIKWG